jgi:hypothetical protein
MKAGLSIMKNKSSLMTVWAESHPWSTTQQTIILKLKMFDRIFLRIQSRASHLHGYGYSNFGGNLLYEIYSN